MPKKELKPKPTSAEPETPGEAVPHTAERTRPITLKSPDKQYIIPYDDINGSDIFDMLVHMANFTNMSRNLRSENIETYKRFFQKIYAKYKVFLYRWLKQNWDSLSKDRQDFAKHFYRKGRMVL